MNDKFIKFRLSIENMRRKVIEAKGGQQVHGLSKPEFSAEKNSKKKQSKTRENH